MNHAQHKIPNCPYCYPEKVDHTQKKINSFLMAYITRPISYLFKSLTFNRPIYFTDRYLTATLILLRKFNLVQIQPDIKIEQTVTRVQLLWNEAQKRGLTLHSFCLNTNQINRQLLSFLLLYKGRKYYFHYSPITLLHKNLKDYEDPTIYDDKFTFKRKLSKNNLPCPEGKSFFS